MSDAEVEVEESKFSTFFQKLNLFKKEVAPVVHLTVTQSWDSLLNRC